MKISARNQIKGTVKTIREGAVNAVVVICRGNHNPIKADITMESVKELGLSPSRSSASRRARSATPSSRPRT